MNKTYHYTRPRSAVGTVFLLFLALILSAALPGETQAQVTELWKIDAPQENWFLNANTERGFTYNEATGNLYVASRQGGVTPVILDAASGDSLGLLQTQMPKADVVDPLWTVEVPVGNWFTDANTERGITYNPATGNLIVASRQGGVTPVRLNAANGDSVGVLDNTNISGGTFPYNQIRATPDGQIFTANLAINQETRIYRWADETATPELIYADSIGGRLGDSFGVVGDTTNVKLLLSGSGSEQVVAFDWDGTDLTLAGQFPVAAGEARGGFSSRTMADSVLISGTGTAPRYMNVEDGTLGTQITSPDVAAADLNSAMLNDMIEYNGRTIAGFGPAFTNGQFYLLDLSDGGTLIDAIGPLGVNTNANNTGGVLFDDANDRLYLMDTNNAIHAYNIADFFPSDVISGGTFAFNQIAATSDGQIFTANLDLGGTAVKVYRWADETAVPELVFDGPMDNATRFGDALGVVGAGDDVTVLLSGSNTGVIAKFAWDGTTLTKEAEFTVDANVGRGGFSTETVSDSILASGTGAAPQFINIEDGTPGSTLSSPDVDAADLNSSMLNDIMMKDGRMFVATGPAFTNGQFYLFEMTETLDLVHTFDPLGLNTNGNNTGGVRFDAANERLYLMETNNAVAAYDISGVLAAEDAMVQIIHNSADPAAQSVDIFVNGTAALEDVDFRTATSFIPLPSGTELDIVVSPADAGIANGVEFPDNILEAGEMYYIVASGVLTTGDFAANPDGVQTGFFLDVIPGAMTTAADDQTFSFIVYHGATDAPTVDVGVRGGALLADDAAYTDYTPYLDVPPGTYTLDVIPSAGTDPVASFEADVNSLGGSTGIALASGFLTPANNQDGEAFGILLVLPDGTTALLPSVSTSNEDLISDLPQQFELGQNYPNPFNPSTNIVYSLPQSAQVQIDVYNVTGQRVATLVNEQKSAGTHTVSFDASNLASGVYLYQIQSGNFREVRKMMLVK